MNEKSISIIVPTYKERENIVPLVQGIHSVLFSYNYEIIFVDDNSGDGIEQVVQSISAQYPVRIVVRKNERGLATAVVEGFKHATGRYMVVMDADLQHPPEFIPSLIKALDDGADFAVSSRYVPGGGMENWSTVRKIISRGAIMLTHLLLPSTRSVKDVTSGFFALKREVISGVNLKPTGWKIMLEILFMGNYRKVVEVPFTFALRKKGTSKLSYKQEIEYLKHIWSLMLRKGEIWRFLKFCLVGGSGIFVNLGVYWLLTRFGGLQEGFLYLVASAISFEVSVISNFTLNDFFTFADRRSRGMVSFWERLLKFNFVSLIGLGLQQGALLLFKEVAGWYDIIALIIGIILATLWNYIANSLWTWK